MNNIQKGGDISPMPLSACAPRVFASNSEAQPLRCSSSAPRAFDSSTESQSPPHAPSTLLNLPPKDGVLPFHKLTIKELVNQGEGFKQRLKIGNLCETLVRELLHSEGFVCYGTTPDNNRPGVVFAQEQKDIVVCPQTLFPLSPYRESWADWRQNLIATSALPIEVKSHSKSFRGLEDFQESTGQSFVTLDDLVPWQKKDPTPRAVVTISQESTFEDLLNGDGLIVADSN